jgi:hypothetical protein
VRELKFLVKEMASVFPRVKLMPLLSMSSDKQMLSFVLKRLSDIESDMKTSDAEHNEDELAEFQIYQFILKALKVSLRRNGAFPPEVSVFRKKTVNMNNKQKQEEILKVISSSKNWV